jgi:hypothetical protein
MEALHNYAKVHAMSAAEIIVDSGGRRVPPMRGPRSNMTR